MMRKNTITAVAVALLALVAASISVGRTEARRGGLPPVQPGNGNCRLANGTIDTRGWPVLDASGAQVGTRRISVLWRYVDANCDGVMTWRPLGATTPLEGADYLRIVPRTIYSFSGAVVPAWRPDRTAQISTFNFGPAGAATGASTVTSFREIHHDDFIAGLPAPGDMIVTQGADGLPVPGLSLAVHLQAGGADADFVPSWDAAAGAINDRWGARFVLSYNPALSNGTIPAGTAMFMDSQLNAYSLVPGPGGACLTGFSEAEWLRGVGGIVAGPNTLATADPGLTPVPVHFAPQCSNNTVP